MGRGPSPAQRARVSGGYSGGTASLTRSGEGRNPGLQVDGPGVEDTGILSALSRQATTSALRDAD